MELNINDKDINEKTINILSSGIKNAMSKKGYSILHVDNSGYVYAELPISEGLIEFYIKNINIDLEILK